MKWFSLFALALLISISATAQIGLGVTAGFQASTHTPADVGVQNKSKIGYLAGFMASVPLSKAVSVRGQVLYSVKGVHTTIPGYPATKITLNYVEIPIQAVYTSESGNGHLHYGAGLYVGYGLSSKSVFGNGGSTYTYRDDFGENIGQFKRVDVGARLSLDYELNSGLMLGVFYAPGLINLNNPATNSTDNFATHNSSLGLSVAYWFKKH